MYSKIQPEQIQLHDFSSPSGHVLFSQGENTVYANLAPTITGDFNFLGNLRISGDSIMVSSGTSVALNNSGQLLAGNLASTGALLAYNLYDTGTTLAANLAYTGNLLAVNLASTGSSLAATGTALNSRLISTGSSLDSRLVSTGSSLDTRLISTGTGLNSKIDTVSGSFTGVKAQAVYNTGDQTVSGIKSFVQGIVVTGTIPTSSADGGTNGMIVASGDFIFYKNPSAWVRFSGDSTWP